MNILYYQIKGDMYHPGCLIMWVYELNSERHIAAANEYQGLMDFILLCNAKKLQWIDDIIEYKYK